MTKLFVVSAVVALVAQLAVLRSVIAGRAPASSPGRTARLAEITWVLIPTVALIAILFFTWNRMGEPVAIAPINGVTA
jgi:heme/copper-type cytochrome/quinol oxidase subunit 2